MVFGRRPRLAGQDITFPSKVIPSPTLSADAEAYVQQLCKRLEQFNLAALDKQLHRKEMLRLRHDNDRSANNIHPYSRGDLVHRYHRTSLPKLQYQWSNPVWLVIKVQANTCALKSLISPQGRQGNQVPSTITNIKHMRPAAPRPSDFWVGARVRRQFHNNWFLGTVVGITTDEGETLYQIEYDDCDQEQLDAGHMIVPRFWPRCCLCGLRFWLRCCLYDLTVLPSLLSLRFCGFGFVVVSAACCFGFTRCCLCGFAVFDFVVVSAVLLIWFHYCLCGSAVLASLLSLWFAVLASFTVVSTVLRF